MSKRIRCYDNGGRSADRYTVVYLDDPQANGLFGSRGMNAYPFHPQGIGMYCTAMPGSHLGKRIKFEDLPADCQKVVRMDLREGMPNPDQLKALIDFAAQNGRGWKAKLDEVWMKASAGPLLQQVRNEFGPSWLTKVTLKQLKAALEDTCT